MARVGRGDRSRGGASREAPAPLPYPLQQILLMNAQHRAMRDKVVELMYTPVGQVVGVMGQELSVRQVIQDMVTELAETTDRYERVVVADEPAASEPAPTNITTK